MTKPIKWNAPPNLAVIDAAIELVRSKVTLFTCWALVRASHEVEPRARRSVLRRNLYLAQYRECVLGPEDKRPKWWNSIHPYKRDRIAALKKFRQACIDAAKKGKR